MITTKIFQPPSDTPPDGGTVGRGEGSEFIIQLPIK